jgi:hypothetical protein
MSALPAPAPLRPAVKLARIAVDLDARTGAFSPWADTLTYTAEAHAECALGRSHTVPHLGCTCGFYAAYDVEGLLTLLQPDHAMLAGSALLDVELGGVELAGPFGVRAAEQRVLGAALVPFCMACDQPDLESPPELYATRSARLPGGPHWVVPLCASHAALTRDAVPVTLGDVAGMLGTEVTWASAEQALLFLDWRDERLAAGEVRGPLAAWRTLGQLRMGQIGFTTAEALRVGDGRVHLDLTAPALQREQGGAYLPILRRVDLAYELVITTGNAEAAEAALLDPRPLAPATSVRRLAHASGLRHAPRLRELFAR